MNNLAFTIIAALSSSAVHARHPLSIEGKSLLIFPQGGAPNVLLSLPRGMHSELFSGKAARIISTKQTGLPFLVGLQLSYGVSERLSLHLASYFCLSPIKYELNCETRKGAGSESRLGPSSERFALLGTFVGLASINARHELQRLPKAGHNMTDQSAIASPVYICTGGEPQRSADVEGQLARSAPLPAGCVFTGSKLQLRAGLHEMFEGDSKRGVQGKIHMMLDTRNSVVASKMHRGAFFARGGPGGRPPVPPHERPGERHPEPHHEHEGPGGRPPAPPHERPGERHHEHDRPGGRPPAPPHERPEERHHEHEGPGGRPPAPPHERPGERHHEHDRPGGRLPLSPHGCDREKPHVLRHSLGKGSPILPREFELYGPAPWTQLLYLAFPLGTHSLGGLK